MPSGVKVGVQNGVVTIEGPKGTLSFKPSVELEIIVQDGKIVVAPMVTGTDGGELSPQQSANYGTARAIINNMVIGVTKAWKRTLEFNGVGFTAKIQGQNLTLAVGFSHDVVVALPKEIKCSVTKNTIDLESVDRQLVGAYASRIRKIQPPEPYLGKGIKYAEETIRRKAGKTGKK